jgi:hypothetical protein
MDARGCTAKYVHSVVPVVSSCVTFALWCVRTLEVVTNYLLGIFYPFTTPVRTVLHIALANFTIRDIGR